MQPQFLSVGDNDRIAYHRYKSETNSDLPGVIFLGGFMSDMEGTKATALQQYCEECDYSFTRFDYFGHGQSSQQFTDGTIGAWRDNAVTVLDEITEGPQILIGSSMGGWIKLLTALARPERVAGLVGIAAAPDFTEDLIWRLLPEHAKKELAEKGIYDLASEYSDTPYPVSMQLIEGGREYLLLRGSIPIHCPVRLIHGMKDDDVPYMISVDLVRQLSSEDTQLTLVKNGDHRMSSPEDIALLCRTLEEMLAICSNTV